MQIKNTSKGYIIRLELGEKFNDVFITFCKSENVSSAYFTAIGAVEQVELAFYDLPTKTYSFRHFESPMELVGMTGNISLVDGQPFIYAHGVFSDKQFVTVGGHVKDLVVGPTIEIFLAPIDEKIERKMNDEVGLKLLDLD
jgi:predicted DNA-binding protein with PD1-like motif